MKIQVEFLLEHTSLICEVSRVPCVDECVDVNGQCYDVKCVIHALGNQRFQK